MIDSKIAMEINHSKINNHSIEPPFYKKTLQFLLASGGIYFFYIYYGIKQEEIFSHNYGTKIDEKVKFRSSFALVFFQAFMTYFFAMFMIGFQNPIHLKDQFFLGLYNTVSMLGSNTALRYVSYPVQALMKSCKIISVILVTFVVGGKKHSRIEVICAVIITIGIFIFNLTGVKKGGDSESSLIGILVLLISLFSDGMLADTQHNVQHVHKNDKNFGTFHVMAATNAFCWVLTLIYGIVSGQILEFINFVYLYPKIWTDIILITGLGCFGQLFIFYTITHFGPIALSILTTTRKFFTVVGSIFLFKHVVSEAQWGSIVLVFFGVFLELGHKVYDKVMKKKIHEK